MQKIYIENRSGQKIAVVIEQPKEQKGLAFVMHGLGGFKEQDHIRACVDTFIDSGYTTISFDTTNTYGESAGNYEDATVTNYFEDLEDVTLWASKQPWYQEPFILSGHSLGGMCSLLYTEKYPEKVRGLAPFSSVISGTLSIEGYKELRPQELKEWETSGWRVQKSVSKPGLIKRLKWSHMLDRLKYDVIPEARNIFVPVLLIVGTEDDITLPKHQQMLYDELPEGSKEIHLIQGAPHTFRDKEHISEMKNLLSSWLKKYF